MEQMVILLAPFAPHIAEELYHALGHETSVCDARWPQFDEKFLVESTVTLGVQFNGKVRFSMAFAADAKPDEMVAQVVNSEEAKRFLEGHDIVKTIAVPGRIVNIVIK
jgi:leucyl-tRNA synthetase